MQFIKLSELLKREIKPFLYGVFLSRIMEENDRMGHYFFAYTSFRASKFVFECDFSMPDYAPVLVDKLNWFSGHRNWTIVKSTNSLTEIRFYVLDDLNITKKAFYKLLYQKMMSSEWVMEDSLTEDKKSFIRGFIECRGSVDTSRRLIAQDYFYDDRNELKKALLLTDMMDVPCEYANFNARDLQPQFVEGTKRRNAQFRINSFYYANKIGFLNDYKALIFKKAYYTRGERECNKIIYYSVNVSTPRSNSSFISYLNFFTNNIYERNLTPSSIDALRRRLGFNTQSPNNERSYRNQTIIDLYREISEDKCAICGTTKTYLNQRTGRQHFEIHHVISYTNGKECDNIANLVKLCPTCHDSLRKNASKKEDQISKIIKILNEHQEVYEFADSYFMTNDINELAEKVWECLG